MQISDEDTLPDVTLESTTIKNMLQSGIHAIHADISLTNTLITNCVSSLINIQGGGNYTCRHCTFTSYSFDFGRELPAVLLSNAYRDIASGEQVIRPLSWVMQNSIIWGGTGFPDEIVIDRNPSAAITIQAENNLVKTRLMDVFSESSNLINSPANPLFVDPSVLNFRPDSLSPLINAGMMLKN